MDENNSASALLEPQLDNDLKAIPSKPHYFQWLVDPGDLFVLFCHFLLTTASIVFIALVIHTEGSESGFPSNSSKILSILQRVIAALTTTVTSAMIMVAGKRYVLFKFARGGISSRRVAVYGSPSIGTLTRYLVQHGLELPLLMLLAVWALGLAAALTVSDVWVMVPFNEDTRIPFFYGPFNTSMPTGSLLSPASAQLDNVIAFVCSGSADIAGVIKITSNGSEFLDLQAGAPTGIVLYPPLPGLTPDTAYSISTALNGFNVSMESIPSMPPAAQDLTCVDNQYGGFKTGQLWYEGSDNHSLSIIATVPVSTTSPAPLYRFNASAIVLGGTLHSTGNTTEFALNGTSWSNVMSDDRWAKDIITLICNTTYAKIGSCDYGPSESPSLINFAMMLNDGDFSVAPRPPDSATPLAVAPVYQGWSTVLGMAIGAYSAAQLAALDAQQQPTPPMELVIDVTDFNYTTFMINHKLYILIANVVVSIVLLVVVVWLRVASHLGGDFIHAARLLLDPLKTPELFNASFDTTVNARANPYMLLRGNSEFVLLMENELPSKEAHRMKWWTWRCR